MSLIMYIESLKGSDCGCKSDNNNLLSDISLSLKKIVIEGLNIQYIKLNFIFIKIMNTNDIGQFVWLQ